MHGISFQHLGRQVLHIYWISIVRRTPLLPPWVLASRAEIFNRICFSDTFWLKLGAAAFCGPLTTMINLTMQTSTIPGQWKQACIKPIPKLATLLKPVDILPISIIPVPTRVMEQIVVQQHIYPALVSLPLSLNLTDQFAFCPTASTTADIITLHNTITNHLSADP